MPKTKRFGVPNSQFEYTKVAQDLDGVAPRAKDYAIALSNFVDRYGAAFPSYSKLGGKTGRKSTKTAQRAVADMKAEGLVRVQRTVRAGQGYSSNQYALILSTGQPSGHHVQAIGQHVPIPPDKESLLNKPGEHTKEQQGRFLILRVEEYLLHKLSSVLDCKRYPKTICLGEVSRWLFNGHSSEQFEPALLRLIDQANRLQSDYLRTGRTLKGWSDLVERLKDDDTKITAAQESGDLHPICQEIWELLPIQEQTHPRSIGNLAMLRPRLDGAVVIFESNSGTAIRYLRENCAPILKLMEGRYGYKLDVRS